MTMQLMHPAFTTTGKKRKKQKFASAEAKHQHDALAREWEAKQKEFIKLGGRSANSCTSFNQRSLSPSIPAGRDTTRHIKSLNTGAAVAPAKQSQVYTGTNVLGISTLHKSNAVPVFSQEEATDIAKMRR
jgi:hypothetical protein